MPKTFHNKIILIAGLTASGKSQLALDIACRINARAAKGLCCALPAGTAEASAAAADVAEAGAVKNGGGEPALLCSEAAAGAPRQKTDAQAAGARAGAVIINADSMQIYEGLRILTARPSAADLRLAPHYLYGFVSPACRFSVGAWLEAVENLLRQPEIFGKTLIFVGGTGLYFRSLLGGLAAIPPISAAVRKQGQALLQHHGLGALYAEVAEHDAEQAARLNRQDSQRILRAWEVLRQTGKSLSFWQQTGSSPLMSAASAQKIILLPPREEAYARINARVEAMIEAGALAEVAALNARGLSPQLPLMKAAGRAALSAYLAGETDLSAAVEKTKQETRRYAKRQRTWFCRQMGADWQVFNSAAAAWAHFCGA